MKTHNPFFKTLSKMYFKEDSKQNNDTK